MIHVRFATNGAVKTIDTLDMGSFERQALKSQLANTNIPENAVKSINQYLCYTHVETVNAFIVWNETKTIKALSTQFRWIGDNLTGYTI